MGIVAPSDASCDGDSSPSSKSINVTICVVKWEKSISFLSTISTFFGVFEYQCEVEAEVKVEIEIDILRIDNEGTVQCNFSL